MAYIYDLSDTWNASGTAFYGIKMNVTNTASASGSKLLSLQVASTEYFGVDKDGNVTIGNGGDLRLSSATGGDASIIYNDAEDLYFNTNGAVRAVINSSGNVGIGTSSPQVRVHVSTTDQSTSRLRLQNTGTGGTTFDIVSGNPGASNSGLGFYDVTSAATRMYIDSSGNVGIGLATPDKPLVVQAASSAYAIGIRGRSADNVGIFQFANYANTVELGKLAHYGTDMLLVNSQAGALAMYTSNSEKMRIDSSGNLLVGTSSTFDNVSYLKFQSLGGVSTKIGGTSLTSQMSFFNDNGRVGWIGTDGTITSYNITSDERLKENIADADDASGLIDAIQVRKFDWKANGSHQRYGFIAQELIEVAPEAVSAPDEEDQMMAVDYSKLVPMLVKELQSLRVRVAELEGK